MNDVLRVFLYAMLTAVATGVGALPFAFVRGISLRFIAYSGAVAAGLMLGASFGLVAEGITHGRGETLVGALVGVVFILVTQRLLGHREGHDLVFEAVEGEGAQKMLLMVIIMTVHSFAEGVAVGVSFGGGAALGAVITVAIALHNVPEGVAITAVLRPRGVSVARCAGWSVFSSLPQPLMAVPAFIFVETFQVALPYGLGFAAGAMIYMVLGELLPEAYEKGNRAQVATIATASTVGMVLFQQWL